MRCSGLSDERPGLHTLIIGRLVMVIVWGRLCSPRLALKLRSRAKPESKNTDADNVNVIFSKIASSGLSLSRVLAGRESGVANAAFDFRGNCGNSSLILVFDVAGMPPHGSYVVGGMQRGNWFSALARCCWRLA